jgi:hypothetical protein
MAAQKTIQCRSTSLKAFQYLAIASKRCCQTCWRANFFGTLYERSYDCRRALNMGNGHVNVMYSRYVQDEDTIYDAFLGRRDSCDDRICSIDNFYPHPRVRFAGTLLLIFMSSHIGVESVYKSRT